MKISTRTRYGTRLMLELASRYGQGSVFLKEVARVEDISEKYLSQIVIPLKAAGLVNSYRGAHGGYVLSRPPEEITLRDIFEVLEGPFTLVPCIEDLSQCRRIAMCVTRNLWDALGKEMAVILGRVSLANLVQQIKEKQQDATMYNI